MSPKNQERLRRFNVNISLPEIERKHVAGLILAGFSIMGTLISSFHCNTMRGQKEVVDAVKSDTSSHSKREVVADLKKILHYDSIIVARLDNINLGDQAIVSNCDKNHKENASAIVDLRAMVHTIDVTDATQNSQIASLRQLIKP